MQDAEKLANHILDTYKITRTTERLVWVDGRKKTKQEFEDALTLKILKDVLGDEVLELPSSKIDALKKEALTLSYEFQKEEAWESMATGGMEESAIDRKVLIPIDNIETGERMLYNLVEEQISTIDIKIWEKHLSKDERGMVDSIAKDVLMEYDPYDIRPIKDIVYESMPIVRLNTYSAPKWRRSADLNEDMPDIIWDLLEHLFPIPEQLDFVLNWMYQAIVDRNQTFLVLNGKKGIGKGVFCSLLKALVGREHFHDAPASLLTGHFNASLDKHRIIVFDELRVTKTEHTKLKKFGNEYQNIEKKGVDADRDKRIYNSYVISNNDISDMHIECDDRRFSVPDLNKAPLLDTISQKDLDRLHIALEDPDGDLVRRVGYYIYNHGKNNQWDVFSWLRSKRFNDLAFNSLFEWKKYIANSIFECNEHEILVHKLRKKYQLENKFSGSKFPHKMQKIKDFLDGYTHNNDHLIGELSKIEGEWYILPNERYLPEDEDFL